MKTDEIKVTREPMKLDSTLDKIELIALYADMTRKDAASMRLLAEELLSAIGGALEAADGRLWMETTDKAFSLHLRMRRPSDKATRDKVIALSKSGEVEAPKGLFRKLSRAMNEMLLGDENDGVLVMVPNYMIMEGAMSGMHNFYTYRYIPNVAPAENVAAQSEDELTGIEKRIIDAIVDDILVTMQGDFVEVIAVKNIEK